MKDSSNMALGKFFLIIWQKYDSNNSSGIHNKTIKNRQQKT